MEFTAFEIALSAALAQIEAQLPYIWGWEATPEEALEKAFKCQGIVDSFGEITLAIKIEELATRIEAIDFANGVLAARELASPQKDILQLNAVKDYLGHVDYWNNCDTNTSEFCAALVYDSVNDGLTPILSSYIQCLVLKNNRGYDSETKQPISFFSVQNWRHLEIDIRNLISGYTHAHKIGELRAGKSHAEMVEGKKVGKSHKKIKLDIKPIFKPESVGRIYTLIKDFFKPEQQSELLMVLKTGNDAEEPLIFLDAGNRLADAFKELIIADFITGCNKSELQRWILKNFKNVYRGEVRSYTIRTLDKIISGTSIECKKSILTTRKNKLTGLLEIQA